MATDLSDRGEAEVEDLVHHGVKGMRWGVITKKASAGRAATARALKKTGRATVRGTQASIKATRTGVAKVQKAKQAHDARKADKIQRKAEIKARKKFANRSYKKISDGELQSRIKRLEQEKRYRELKADRHLVRGREVTRQILEGSITKAGTYASTKIMKSAFDNAFEGATGKPGKSGLGEKVKKAAEKAKQGAEEAMAAAEEVSKESRAEVKRALPKKKSAEPKQIEKPKSYKQTKPTPKKKRYPRNPGSTAK